MTSDEFYIKQTIKTHNENNMLPPPIDEHEALNIISEIIVDGYIAEPIGSKQVYTIIGGLEYLERLDYFEYKFLLEKVAKRI